ncbi:hypothetical protein [Streptomyces sp. NPDC055299]
MRTLVRSRLAPFALYEQQRNRSLAPVARELSLGVPLEAGR